MAHETPKVNAEPRERLGTKYARRLRRDGKLPVVIYGHKEDPAHVTVDHGQMVHLLHDGAHLLELNHDGKSETCLIKDVQYDYLGTDIIHVDLTRIDLTEEVTVMVPVEVKGEDQCPGLQAAGAILEQPLVDIEITCRANAIPDSITIDISELGEEDSYLVSDLKLPPGVATEQNPDDAVVVIRVVEEIPEEELEPTPEAAAEEPEVVSERKEEEGEPAEGGAEAEAE